MAGTVDGYLNFDARLNTKNFERDIKSLSSKFGDLQTTVSRLGRTVATVFSTAVIVNFGKQAVQTASQLSNAMTGLKSIVEGQGRSFAGANKYIQDYISDGLVPLQNAVTAYKNLASRGYSDEQIQRVMNSLKNSATYGRQASLTLGYAVQSATEGLKNENSILVDNAGVTKNVSVMWKDYAESIGTTYANLTKQQKIQAEVNGIIEETKFQMKDAEKASNTFMGQTAKLSANFTNLKVAIGNTIIPALQRIIPVINSIIQKLTAFFTKMAIYSELLFGIKKATDTTTASTNKTASATDGLADAQTDVADATADANKEMKSNLANMDELNILASESGDALKDAVNTDGLNFGGLDAEVTVKDGIDPKIALKIEELKGKIQKLIDTAKSKFKELWGIIEPFRTFVANGAKDFYNSFLKPLAKWTIGKGLPKLQEILEKFMKNTNWSKLNTSLKDFWEALEPFAENIGEGLLWFLDNVLEPLAQWAVSDLIPAFLDTLSAAIDSINETLEALKPLAQVLFDYLLKPLAKLAGSAIVSVLNGIKEHMDAIVGILLVIAPLIAADVIGKFVLSLGKLKGVQVAVFTVIKVFGALKTIFGIIVASGGSIMTMFVGFELAFKSFCASFAAAFTPFQKVLIIVGSVIAIFITAEKIFKKLGDGTISIKKAISNLILVLAPLGVALYAILGPIGLVIEGIALLAGAVAGTIKSAKEELQQNFNDEVFNGIGTPITEYSDAVSALADNITEKQQSIIDLGGTIDSTNSQIEQSIDDLAMYIGTFNSTGEMTEENAQQISNATSSIADGIRSNMTNQTQMVIEALGTSFKDAALQSTEGTNEIISNMYLLNSQGDKMLADLQQQIDDTAYSLSTMDKDSPEYAEQSQKLNDLVAKMADYSMSTSASAKELQTFQNQIDALKGQDIDLMDADTAKKSIETIKQSYQDAFTSLDKAESTAITNAQALIKQYEAMGLEISPEVKNAPQSIKASYDKQKAELQNTIQGIADDLQSTVDKKMSDTWAKTKNNLYDGSVKNFVYYTASGVKGLFGGKEVEDVIKSDFTDSAVTGMQDSMVDLQSTLKANGNLIGKGLSDGVKSGVDENLSSKTFQDTGMNLALGLKNGIDSNSNKATSSAHSMMSNVITDTKETAGVHSPSTVFEEIGLNLMLGLKNGIQGSSIFVSTALKSMADTMISNAKQWFEPLTNVFEVIFINIADIFKQTILTAIADVNSMLEGFNSFSFKVPEITSGTSFMLNMPKIPIPKLATGTVVPANYGEFLATLGDNKRETEIVSPLSTMKQALYEALQDADVNGGNITIPVYIGNECIERLVVTAQQRKNAKNNGWR